MLSKIENFKVVCAWCKKPISGNPDATIISHGMCEKCAVEFQEQKRIIERMEDRND